MVLEKNLESPLDSKEIKPVNPKGYLFMSKSQYRKIPEFSLNFLVVITNVYPESTYWVQTLHS